MVISCIWISSNGQRLPQIITSSFFFKKITVARFFHQCRVVVLHWTLIKINQGLSSYEKCVLPSHKFRSKLIRLWHQSSHKDGTFALWLCPVNHCRCWDSLIEESRPQVSVRATITHLQVSNKYRVPKKCLPMLMWKPSGVYYSFEKKIPSRLSQIFGPSLPF